jgi:hypothetical protein
MASKSKGKKLVVVKDITDEFDLKGNGGGAPAPVAAASAMPVPFDLDRMISGYQQAPRPAAGGSMFLKMVKGSGMWIFGQEEEEIPEPTLLAVNPASFQHGWIAWRDTSVKGTSVEKLGEKMVPAYEAMPEPGPTPAGAKQWDQQLGVSFKRMDTGHSLIYLTTAVGGKRAVTELRDKVLAKMAQARASFGSEAAVKGDIIALVKLSHDSYQHSNKTFGRIFVPIFSPTGWVTHARAEALATKLAAKA